MSGMIKYQQQQKNHENNNKGHHGKTQQAVLLHRMNHPCKTSEKDQKMDRLWNNYSSALFTGRQSPAKSTIFSIQLPGGGGRRVLQGLQVEVNQMVPSALGSGRGALQVPASQPGYLYPWDVGRPEAILSYRRKKTDFLEMSILLKNLRKINDITLITNNILWKRQFYMVF